MIEPTTRSDKEQLSKHQPSIITRKFPGTMSDPSLGETPVPTQTPATAVPLGAEPRATSPPPPPPPQAPQPPPVMGMTTRPQSKKRSRAEGTSPVPDALFQSALVQAAQICSNLGLLGLAACLTTAASSSSSSAGGSPGLPRPETVRAAALKAHADSPPWAHWSKADMAPSFKVLGPHRLGLQGAYRGYRMARGEFRVLITCMHACMILPDWMCFCISVLFVVSNFN